MVPWLYYCDPLEGKDPYTGQLVQPSICIDVSGQIDGKMEMLACHASQREWLRQHHGMDEYIEALKRHGALRGGPLGVAYAEAFTQHLGHAYPQSDLLREIEKELVAATTPRPFSSFPRNGMTRPVIVTQKASA